MNTLDATVHSPELEKPFGFLYRTSMIAMSDLEGVYDLSAQTFKISPRAAIGDATTVSMRTGKDGGSDEVLADDEEVDGGVIVK